MKLTISPRKRMVTLRRVNTLLLLAIIGVNSYLVILPFIPMASYWLEQEFSHTASDLQKQISIPLTKTATEQGNRLIIPRMLLDQPIIDGPDMRALNFGPWRRPKTSTPDKGSNTVIAGHRYTYTNPRGTFYHLDLLQKGDQIGVFWQGKRYVYVVNDVSSVPPDQIQVEAPTTGSILTLYTCTPLWLPKDRLVVTATLKEVSS